MCCVAYAKVTRGAISFLLNRFALKELAYPSDLIITVKGSKFNDSHSDIKYCNEYVLEE